MELGNMACMVEQAKKLDKLLGDDAPKSLLVWCEAYNDAGFVLKLRDGTPFEFYKNAYSAYTGDELGVLLPDYLFLETNKTCLRIFKFGKNFRCDYQGTNLNEPFTSKFAFVERYEAHAKAYLLIHLIEQKLIDPKDLKL